MLTPGSYTVTNSVPYGNGCLKNSSETIDILKVGTVKPKFHVYPNPGKDKVTIAFESTIKHAQIQLLNMLGETVFTEIASCEGNLIYLDIEKIPAGSYILKINSELLPATQIIEIL